VSRSSLFHNEQEQRGQQETMETDVQCVLSLNDPVCESTAAGVVS
jgi:hypothetical protein